MMAPNLPQIRVADIDLLSEWDLSENVRALGDSIPGYRSSASMSTSPPSPRHLYLLHLCSLLPLLSVLGITLLHPMHRDIMC